VNYVLNVSLLLIIHQIFTFIAVVPHGVILAPRNGLVFAATCDLIASSLTREEIEVSSVPGWRNIVDQALRHRSSSVQEAAAAAMATISSLTDCSSEVHR